MIELVLAGDDVMALRAALIGGATEKCAILYASQTSRTDETVRLLVREIEFPSLNDYSSRGLHEAELKPELVARVTKRARLEGLALVFAHSHPGSQAPAFSSTDDVGEKRLAAFLAHRHATVEHGTLVMSAGGVCARRLGASDALRVLSLGVDRDVLYDPSVPGQAVSEAFDRQVRAFGKGAQEILQRLRIAIVGLGGTGSVVAQQLVHLGVRNFILVDPDTLETTNLNRVANASERDLGDAKVEIAARYIRAFAKYAQVECVTGDVVQVKTARRLIDADMIFGCTDSHGSRAVLQQVSFQYMIPCIDMGVTIAVSESRITHVYGRVQLLAPGLACFTCDGLLNAEEVRRDMMTEFERQSDPYVQGLHEPAPAVMSLNSSVASLAITMMLSVVTGLPAAGRHILYNALAPTLRSVRAKPQENCFICSRSGSYARGDAWPLFARES